jgi:hypothetical protein
MAAFDAVLFDWKGTLSVKGSRDNGQGEGGSSKARKQERLAQALSHISLELFHRGWSGDLTSLYHQTDSDWEMKKRVDGIVVDKGTVLASVLREISILENNEEDINRFVSFFLESIRGMSERPLFLYISNINFSSLLNLIDFFHNRTIHVISWFLRDSSGHKVTQNTDCNCAKQSSPEESLPSIPRGDRCVAIR